MSITDELRKWASVEVPYKYGHQLNAIADRIDAEHERVCYDYQREFEDWKFVHDTEFVELPKDMDGEPIHIGDVIVTTEWHKEVVEGILPERVLVLRDGEWFTIRADWCKRHAPTVKDVLRGVVELCHNTWKEGSAFEFYDVDDVMKSGNIADFAAKLRLAGDAE